MSETRLLSDLIKACSPSVILTFGSFSYEFTRRSLGHFPEHAYSHWTCKRLGNEFRQSIRTLDFCQASIVPLLHATIARRHFLSNHSAFTGSEAGNYFEFVGELVANRLLVSRNRIPETVWLVSGSTKNS